jgi:P4 family phage/plasmid primase-like protien
MAETRLNLKTIKNVLKKPEVFRNSDYQGKACFSRAYKTYGFFDDWDIALNLLDNIAENEKNFNELILSPAKVKPYLDIEWMQSSFPELDPDVVKNNIKTLLKDIFNEHFDYSLDSKNIYFASCHRPKQGDIKYSFHVVVSTEPKIVFENANACSVLPILLRQKCTELFNPSIVDTAVYKKTQNIRLVGHCKEGETFPFIKEQFNDSRSYLITDIGRSYISLKSVEQEDELHKDYKENSEISDNILEEMREYALDLHPSCDLGQESGNGFVQFNYSDRSEPCFCHPETDVFHDKIGFFMYSKNGAIYAGCHSGNCVTDSNKKIIKILGSVETKELPLSYEGVSVDNDIKLDYFEVKKRINSAALGASEMFNLMYNRPQRIKLYCVNDVVRSAYIWDGRIWVKDTPSNVGLILVKTVLKVISEFINQCKIIETDTASMDKILKEASNMRKQLESGKLTAPSLHFSKPVLRDDAFFKIKDTHPHFLACQNGMVDLVSGEIRDYVLEDNVTKTLEVDYNENADSSLFDNFIKEITSSEKGEQPELYNYLKWCLGYALQGRPTKKLFIILYGPHGYNGKSLLLNTISSILGDYSTTMNSSVVLEGGQRSAGGASPDLCQLENKRLGILSDTSEGAVINDGQIKQLTGITDLINTRELYENQREFRPIFVPIICTNNPIKINLSDSAMYNRLILFPFVLSFVSNPSKSYERLGDDDLAYKFDSDKEGVLKWLIEASLYYNRNLDMNPPECLTIAKDLYNEAVNPRIAFINSTFDKDTKDYTGPEHIIKRKDLLDLYKIYANNNKCTYKESKDAKEFDKILNKRVVKNKADVYVGIKLKQEFIESAFAED